MKLIAALTVPVLLLVAQTEPSAPHNVLAIRHWSLSDVTRIAVEVSGEFQFRTDRLHNPERVYFDILNARPRLSQRRGYAETISDDKRLLRIRVAETTPGITRIVLDLGGPMETTSSTLTNPNRLIVELRNSRPPAVSTEPPVTPPADLPVIPRPPVRPPVTLKPEPAQLDAPPNATPAPKTAAKTEAAHTIPVIPPALIDPPKGEPAESESPKPTGPKPEPAVAAIPPSPSPPEEVGKAARHTSSGGNSLIRALGLKINRVVIDPGHGGHDEGTTGPKGLLEKDLVLDVAKRLGDMVEQQMGAEVIYTRTDDTFVPLEGRTALANEKKADLFLSIHANSSSIPRIAGVETFYLNITGTKDALDVAARENASSQKSIFELQDIIKKITLHDKAEESHEFARRIQAAMYAFSVKSVPSSKDRGVKTAPFVVLIGAQMPSVLAEIGFLSNPKEEALLKKPDYRQKLAEALYKGMDRYTQSLSHFQVAAKPQP
ncbi:MAG TPA: N-acetylmuramoyl-L-alanine amidase [Bryobacteraceae bacterium]|nr:N-acetylmuramoyl-L-alanine amidase [Bryobacteraceae bacterium]